MNWILARLGEPSTHAAIGALLGLIGLSTELTAPIIEIISAGFLIAAVVMKEKK